MKRHQVRKFGITKVAALMLILSACSSRDADGFLKNNKPTGPQESFIPATGKATHYASRHTASSYPVDYYISVPKGWPGKRAWPVVMTITGSGKDFQANAELFAEMRDKRGDPFIVISPILFTNGGEGPVRRNHPKYTYPDSVWNQVDKVGRCAFDAAAIRAVLDDAHKLYAGESKMFLTGWSGGGHTGFATIFSQPELLNGVALVGANYLGRCVTFETMTPFIFSSAPERVQLPIKILNGENDTFRPIGTKQQAAAIDTAHNHGFTNITSEVVPKLVHEPMPQLVLSYFLSMVPAERR